MKKLISLLMATAMLLTLCACGGGDGEPQTPPEEETASLSTDTVTIDAICVDDSYRDKDESPLRMVYLFMTVTAQDENLKVDSKGTTLTVNDANTYTSEHYPCACDFMPSYYDSDYLEDIYVGDSLKLATAFKIPEADLAPGRTLTLADSQIPTLEEITLTTDDLQHFDSYDALAQAADPDGYAEAVAKREPADPETTAQVEKYLNGYYWSFFVNNTSYEIEFYAGNRYDLRTAFGTASGSYAVTKGYIICTVDGTGAVTEIPYTLADGDIDLKAADGYDVKTSH